MSIEMPAMHEIPHRPTQEDIQQRSADYFERLASYYAVASHRKRSELEEARNQIKKLIEDTRAGNAASNEIAGLYRGYEADDLETLLDLMPKPEEVADIQINLLGKPEYLSKALFEYVNLKDKMVWKSKGEQQEIVVAAAGKVDAALRVKDKAALRQALEDGFAVARAGGYWPDNAQDIIAYLDDLDERGEDVPWAELAL